VRLRIADLDRSLGFYEQVLGLRILQREGSEARLGTAAGTELVELAGGGGIRPAPGRGRTGLFHFAILLPDRTSLGRFARHLGDRGLVPGAADHLVSEALYLHDPDNLGIEVYADRPRTAWRRRGRELMMATDPLDVTGLLEAAGEEAWEGIPAQALLGHVHLHVGDLDLAGAFFSEGLGFDRTVWGYPGALFLGAGGYHHHLGTNVWAGPRATRPSPDEARLLEWTIELPTEASVGAAGDSLDRSNHEVVREESGDRGLTVTARDPWGTAVRLRAVAAD
jgi:catechol 2,3-dioxygenase